MSETEGQRNDSPLLSERGVTTISDTVVSSLAGMAAQEVDGVHMGGGASRAAGGVLGSITGSESRTSGISVEVGRTETAIDLKMGIEYNKNILQTVEEVRRRITDRVESMTGLRIKELNVTITDITFPEKEARRRLGRAKPPSDPDESQEEIPATAAETRATPEDEPGEPAERETTQTETTVSETRYANRSNQPITATSGCRRERPPSSWRVRGQTSRTSKIRRRPVPRAHRLAGRMGNGDGDETTIASGAGSRRVGRRKRRSMNTTMLRTRPTLIARP